MSKIKSLIVFLFLFSCISGSAQDRIVNQSTSVWYQYYHTLHFSNKWMVDTDLAVRHPWKGSISRLHFRTGFDYRINSALTIGGGYLIGKSLGTTSRSVENRFHQQVGLNHRVSRFSVSHRLRFEQQIVHPTAGNSFWNVRHRYRIMLGIPIFRFSESSRIEASFGDEILLNKGGNSGSDFFDSNRILAGLKFHFGKHNQLSVLYNRQFASTGTENIYSLDHIIWVGFQQAIYLKK